MYNGNIEFVPIVVKVSLADSFGIEKKGSNGMFLNIFSLRPHFTYYYVSPQCAVCLAKVLQRSLDPATFTRQVYIAGNACENTLKLVCPFKQESWPPSATSTRCHTSWPLGRLRICCRSAINMRSRAIYFLKATCSRGRWPKSSSSTNGKALRYCTIIPMVSNINITYAGPTFVAIYSYIMHAYTICIFELFL